MNVYIKCVMRVRQQNCTFNVTDGRAIAETYDSRYIEVSAVLNHMVDELLVRILRCIRDTKDSGPMDGRLTDHRGSDEGGCLDKAKGCVLKKLLKSSSTSCCDVIEFT